MTRETLIAYMVAEARAEDARAPTDETPHPFDMDGFGNFFPEYRSDAAEHGVEWDDELWIDAYDAYMSAYYGTGKAVKHVANYMSRWQDDDQVGTYDARCGGEDGTEPIESFISVGWNVYAPTNKWWAVIDEDEDGEGPGIVSQHPSRKAAWNAALELLALRTEEHRP